MSIAIAAVGAKVKYCAEATAGTRPTTGYTTLPEVITAPEIEKTRNMIECSSITDEEEEYAEGKISFTNNGTFELKNNDDARTGWDALRTAYQTAKITGKSVWCEYAYSSGKSFYFVIAPGEAGNAGLEADGVKMPCPCGIKKVAGWAEASTT